MKDLSHLLSTSRMRFKAGTECGMVFEKFNDIQPEDMIEAHIMVEVPR